MLLNTAISLSMCIIQWRLPVLVLCKHLSVIQASATEVLNIQLTVVYISSTVWNELTTETALNLGSP